MATIELAASRIAAPWPRPKSWRLIVAEALDIGGLQNGESQKFRNVARNGLASFVVDDVLPPFQPRGIEIRGHAEALPDGGQRISPNFSQALIRLTPGRIISWNLTSGDLAQTHSARNV